MREAALDFGCGLGRLTRALARHFRLACGVDISPRMAEQARELHRDVSNCSFQTTDGTLAFPSAHFDLIYSVLVLQHLPTRAAIGSTLRELVRTLRPGGLHCFQIPSRLPLRRRWQLRRRLYGLLRAAGIGEQVLYERCRLHPIRMGAAALTATHPATRRCWVPCAILPPGRDSPGWSAPDDFVGPGGALCRRGFESVWFITPDRVKSGRS